MEGLSHKESEYGLEMSEQENTVILTFPCSLRSAHVPSRRNLVEEGIVWYLMNIALVKSRLITMLVGCLLLPTITSVYH